MVKLGGVSFGNFLCQLIKLENYLALCNFPRVHQHPLKILKDQFFSTGFYPRTIVLKTPAGLIRAKLYNCKDLSTANLVFCRQDYYVPKSCEIVVDVGANIGLTCMFWLSRNPNMFEFCMHTKKI